MDLIGEIMSNIQIMFLKYLLLPTSFISNLTVGVGLGQNLSLLAQPHYRPSMKNILNC
jgi:hypothetical protein